MAVINLKNREMECKIVYYGPGRCGKTTNLEQIFKKNKKMMTGDMVSVDTDGDSTLYFDFAPMGLGKIKGCEVKVQLYTVPGQVQYSSTRKLVLRGVDGIVFVADSLKVRREKNMISLKDLAENLKEYGLSIFKVPLILQYNKRDLAKEGLPILSVETLQKDLNRQLKVPYREASAIVGEGVNETFKAIIVSTLKSLKSEVGW
jgi:signal recognition particle receptor subunit beta